LIHRTLGGDTLRNKLPPLEFAGQTTADLLACKESHSLSSVVFAFEWGIQAKGRKVGEQRLTEEERTVLAVLALQREVNNGGYFQFFWNSSRKYSPVVVGAFRRVGFSEAAVLTDRAIAALGVAEVTVDSVSEAILKEDPVRDAIFDDCDKEFYKLPSMFPAMLEFIVANAGSIQLERTDDYPRRPKRKDFQLSTAAKLETRLHFWRKGWRPTLDEARETASEIAKQENLGATDADIEKAALLFVFGRAMHFEDLALCERLAISVFERMNGEPMHTVSRRNWVELLLKHGRAVDADAWALSYLQHIQTSEPPDGPSQKNLEFWGVVLQENRESLPKAVAFFEEIFPQVDLTKPVPQTLIFDTKRVPGTGPLSK
jgi:hypothetical protein